ncbi:MAG TPA: hypothetical protein VKB09_02735 [Thermomicrobiales bacterium]|nr:hypothetical protein [Thermomicrobiales bacterium]
MLYLYEREGTNCENLPETHAFLHELRNTIDREYLGQGRILLGEANQWPEQVIEYFGGGETPEFHMSFHFPLMPRLYIGLAKADRTPIAEIIYRTPPLWASSTTATRSAWATISRSRTATGCGRRCSGARSRAPDSRPGRR